MKNWLSNSNLINQRQCILKCEQDKASIIEHICCRIHQHIVHQGDTTEGAEDGKKMVMTQESFGDIQWSQILLLRENKQTGEELDEFPI